MSEALSMAPVPRVAAKLISCVLPDDGTDPVELLEVADRRLFEAKDSGRNCVVGPQD